MDDMNEMNDMDTSDTASPARRYRPARVGGCLNAEVERRPDGTLVLRSTEPLGEYPARLTDRLEDFAASAPERVFVAKRGPDGAWRTITYAQMLDRVRRIGQALATRAAAARSRWSGRSPSCRTTTSST